uniref:Uncharacterized protein n=1 Tax=Lactuca sativa TaxID=4236 RepID=A0A9R1XMJ9_LACSA|nr:hypothetical protein LSAT_V11C200053670 [Lactuca sativa]
MYLLKHYQQLGNTHQAIVFYIVEFMSKFSVSGIWKRWRESYPKDVFSGRGEEHQADSSKDLSSKIRNQLAIIALKSFCRTLTFVSDLSIR